MACLFLDWAFVDVHIVPHLDASGLMCLSLTSKSFQQPEIAAALKMVLARSLGESLEKFNTSQVIPRRDVDVALKIFMRPARIPVKFAGPRWDSFRLDIVVQRVRSREFAGICAGWEQFGDVTHLNWIILATFNIECGCLVLHISSVKSNFRPQRVVGIRRKDYKPARFIHLGFGPLPHPAGPHPDVAFIKRCVP